jgi:DNA/RNA endonuclease G (NUC1)
VQHVCRLAHVPVSVDEIEAQTGYDFLSDVDPAIQAAVEARVDME